jgi:hypothetical protein
MTNVSCTPCEPHKRLAQEIQRIGDSDEILSRRTRGQVTPEQVGQFRKGEVNPLPSWKTIAKLLSRCNLSPSDIGQELHS